MRIVILNEFLLQKLHMARLRKIGPLDYFGDTLSEAEAMQRACNAEIVLIDGFKVPLSRAVIESAGNLRLAVLGSTAFHMADLNAARERGVSIANTPGYATDSVAEHAIALMLAVAKVIPLAHRAMQKRSFHVDENNREHERFCGLELRGKTLGIIGLGAIGRRVAEIGAGLGMRVVAYNRSPVLCDKVEPMSLDDVLKVSDVVSIHLALNMQTKNIISSREFALMKPSAILVNTADPGHVDSASLYRAVAEKRIWGVGLDGVTDGGDQSLLLAMNNVVMSPLSASWTREALRKRADAIVATVEDYVKGQPANIVGQSSNASLTHALLKLDGVFLFASDIDDYNEWTLRECNGHGGFELVRNSTEPFENWFRTRYEAKAKREGRETRYLTFGKT